LAFNREYLENGELRRYMPIRAEHQIDRAFLKMYSMDGIPLIGVHYKERCVAFLCIFSIVNLKLCNVARENVFLKRPCWTVCSAIVNFEANKF